MSLPNGLSTDSIISLLGRTTRTSFITEQLIQILSQIRHSALGRVPENVRRSFESPITVKAIKLLVLLAVIRHANKLLSQAVLNNWQRDRSWDWKREVVVLSGGSSGIGLEIARTFARRGVRVVILDKQPPTSSLPSNVYYVSADVTSSTSIKAAAEDIRQRLGDPTVLINNAGVGSGGTILTESESNIRRTFDVNILAHFLMVKEFGPSLIKNNHGHIVTIASMSSFVALGGMVDYACTKAGTLAFHEGLAQELKHWYNAGKVRTSIVHPSWVRTPLIQKLTSAESGFRGSVLSPELVAEAIVDQVFSGNSGHVMLPARQGMYSMVRALPSWLQESLRNKGSETTKHFSKA